MGLTTGLPRICPHQVAVAHSPGFLDTATMAALLREIRHGWRLIWRTPAQSLSAVTVLALGIGLTTALFSVVYAVLLKPLPYANPEQLVIVASTDPSEPPEPLVMTGARVLGVEALAAESALFQAVAPFDINSHRAYAWLGGDSDGDGEAAAMERLRVGLVTPAFFPLLGVQANLGRTFREDDVGAEAVISDGLWRRRFGADPGIVGRAVRFDAETRTIVGVLPPGVRVSYLEDVEVWGLLPPGQFRPRDRWLRFHVLARLRPGVRVEQATAALRTVPGLMPRSAQQGDWRVVAQPVRDWVSGAYRPAFRLLSGAVLLLLVTACLNASVLLLTRAIRRAPETAVRAALGATRRQLLRRDLVESGVVGLGGVVLGTGLAVGVLPLVRRLVPPMVPRLDELAINPWVIGVAVTAGAAATLVTGLVTYRGVSAQVLTLCPGAPGAAALPPRRGRAWRRALLVAQTALIVVLLAGGGLLLHSFSRLTQVDLGYQSRDLMVLYVSYRSKGLEYSEQDELRFREAVRRRIMEIPGVSEVSTSSGFPTMASSGRTWVPRGEPVPTGTRVLVRSRYVTPGFIRMLGIRLLAGRDFSARDTPDAPPVVILSAALARHLYGDQSPVGRTFYWGDPYDVVGVVDDVRWRRPDTPPEPAFYMPMAQHDSSFIYVLARTPLDLPSFAAAARAAAHAVDPRQAVNVVTTVDQLVADAVAEPRFYALATVGFGVLALVLGAVGIFGAVSAAVSERVHEIGVRVALGAGPRAVQRLVLAQALGPVVLGVGLGGVAAFWVVRSLRSLLFEVSPADPLTFVAVPLVVLGAAGLAAWLPARWALRINPVDALRQE